MDETGDIIATGNVGQGEVIGDGPPLACAFPWSVEVKETDFYFLKIAHRLGPTYSLNDLISMGWKVSLELGS